MVFLIAGTTAILSMGAMPALADNGPHVSSAFGAGVAGSVTTGVNTDRCAGCHRAHTGQGAFLLTATDETQLCYTCHGESGTGATTNVMDGIKYSAGTTGANKALTAGQPSNNSVIEGALRGGGFVKAAIGTGHMFQYYNTTVASTCTRTEGTAGGCKFAELIPPLYTSYTGDTSSSTAASGATGVTNSGTYVLEAATSAHSVDSSTQIAWGSGTSGSYTNDATVNLSCVSCHDPHGNGNYRILRPIPTGAASGTPAVTIADSGTKTYTTSNYWLVDDPNSTQITVATAATSVYASSNFLFNISAWCATCHNRLFDGSSSWANALQNPVATSVTLAKGAGTAAGTYATQGGVQFATVLSPLPADGTPVLFTSFGTGVGPSLRTMYYLKGCAVVTTTTQCMLTTDVAGTTYLAITTAGTANIVAGTRVTWTAGSSTITQSAGTVPVAASQLVMLAVTAAVAANNPNLGIYTGRNYKVVALTSTTFKIQSYDAHSGGAWSDVKPGIAGSGMYVVGTDNLGAATGAVTQDGSYMFRHTSDKGYVSSTSGATGTLGVGTRDEWNNNPNCITCHVAHGSNASMTGDVNSTTSGAVTFPDASTGDSFLLRVDNRGTCRSCHNY